MDPGDADRGHRVGLRDVSRVPRSVRPPRDASLNFTAYVGHSAVRLYVMGDAAYERAATPDEIEQMCGARARGDRARARPGSPPASRSRTAASTASPCRAASPTPTKSRRCSSRRAKPGRAWCSSRPASSAATPTCTSGSPRVGRPFTYPLFAAPARQAPRAGAAARGGPGARRGRVAAGDAPPAHHAVHDGRRVQPQHGQGLRRADEGEPRRAPRGVPRSRVAGARPRPTSRNRR